MGNQSVQHSPSYDPLGHSEEVSRKMTVDGSVPLSAKQIWDALPFSSVSSVNSHSTESVKKKTLESVAPQPPTNQASDARLASSIAPTPSALEALAPYKPSTPLLAPPPPKFAPLIPPNALGRSDHVAVPYRLIQTSEDLYTTATAASSLATESVKEYEKEIHQLNLDHLAKVREAAERSQEHWVWGILRKIGSMVMAAFSFVFGVGLAASGNPVGIVLIIAGVLLVANMILSETGTWNWVAKTIAGDDEEKRQMLEFLLPLAVSLCAAALSLAGGSDALNWQALDLEHKLLIIVQTAVGLYQGVVQIGQGVTDYKISVSQADVIHVKKLLAVAEHEIKESLTVLEKITQGLSASTKEVRKAIQQITATYDQMNTLQA